jgi:hypothetical protein
MGIGNKWQYSVVIASLLMLYHHLDAQQTKRFSLLTPEATGVKFENTITDEKDHNILLYSNYYGGGGVGIGDFNKDGLADIFFAGNLVPDQLYFNAGDLTFVDAGEMAGIIKDDGWSSGVIVGDVNHDGWDDIYVTRELYDEKASWRKNLLYINTGQTFPMDNGILGVRFVEKAAAYGLDDDGRTRHAGFLDYDHDGLLDIFILNQPPNPGNYSAFMGQDLMQEKWAPRLMRNRGDGSFEDVTRFAGVLKPCYPNSMVTGDFNQDGWVDIYISNDYEAPDFLYINNGDGTFTDRLKDQLNHISYYAMGVDAGDINNDGLLDIMTLDMVAEDNFRLKANMSGMNPKAFWNVVDQGGHYQYMFNAMHLNQGGGRWSDIAQLSGFPSTDWSWSNLIADYDNDGWKDVYITNGLLRDIRNTDASKTFPNYVRKQIDDYIKAYPTAGEVSIFDILDLDEALSLIPSVPQKNYMFKNEGDLTFSKVMDEWGLDALSFSNGSAYSDLDNDGDLDLIVNNINAPAFLYRNNAESFVGANWLRIKVTDKEKHSSLFGTKFQIKDSNGGIQFRELSSVHGMYSCSENIAHFGVGTNSIVDHLEVTLPDGSIYQASEIPVNQQLEIDVAEFVPPAQASAKGEKPIFEMVNEQIPFDFRHTENAFDDYAKQVLLPHKMSQFGPALATADVNGDGRQDVFAGGALGQKSVLFIQEPGGSFTELVIDDDPLFEDLDAVFFDVDNDNDMDLYVVSGGNAFPPQSPQYQDRLYINEKGALSRSEDRLPKFRDSGGAVRPFDFDADGDLDLLICGRHQPWSYPSPAVSRLLENQEGSFKDVTKKRAPDLVNIGLVTDAIWMDYDGDNDIDFVLSGEWMPITFFENQEGHFKKNEHIIPNSTGWWYSLALADIDADGDQDLVAGNLGLNYKYQASVDEPFEVHYDDFDENGSKDIVLSYYNFGEQFPLRGRSCSSEQIPDLKKKFPSYTEFASANMSTVYGEKNLEKALHYQAQTFASAIFENKGNGKFEMVPLPNEAQISSINDFMIEDVNGDGHLDIVAAGNLFTSEIETTRNDAGIGILLLGDSRGNWTPTSYAQSGISIPFDVKKIRKIEIEGVSYLMFGCNNDAVRFLKYRSPLKEESQ